VPIRFYEIGAALEHPLQVGRTEFRAQDGRTIAGDDLSWFVLGDSRGLAEVENLHCLAWSPDSKLLAVGGGDDQKSNPATLMILDLENRGRILRPRGQERPVWAVAWSRDGKTLASLDGGGTVALWDASTGQQRRTFSARQGDSQPNVPNAPVSIAWGPNDAWLAISEANDATAGKKLREAAGGANDHGAGTSPSALIRTHLAHSPGCLCHSDLIRTTPDLRASVLPTYDGPAPQPNFANLLRSHRRHIDRRMLAAEAYRRANPSRLRWDSWHR
jgi:hypothetical protein